jgi:serine/threonine-protein kinase
MTTGAMEAGQVIGGRYRLEERVGGDGGPQGLLWRASDTLAAEAPMALRQIGAEGDQQRIRELWSRLQGVLHPQVPRLGAAIDEGDQLWLVRDWQVGRTYQQLLEARRERQLVFGAGEVLLLLRQLLPALAALHGQELLHGDLSAANLLRRDSDGLPVLLDFGLLRDARPAGDAAAGATPGYAPPELARGEAPRPWIDLHALGVLALVLLSGDEPQALLDPASLEWRWPAALESEPALREQLQRLLARDPRRRFATAAEALLAFQALEMPDSTGPVPRADRTVVLVPPPAAEAEKAAAAGGAAAADTETAATEAAAAEAPEPSAADGADGAEVPVAAAAVPAAPPLSPPPRPRYLDKEEAAEGGLWPILIALVVSAVAGTALGWWWLGRDKAPPPGPRVEAELPSSLPPTEVDQRQQLLNRLRALQVDRGWFLGLVDASLLAQYPERKGRLPSDALEDAPLRRVWNELAQEWLVRVEQLPLEVRRRLGSFSGADWDRRQADLVRAGLSPEVLKELVSGSARNLLPGRSGLEMPPEPFRQLWFAAAELTLANIDIEVIEVRPGLTQVVAADVPANGARLFPISLPADHALALGANGPPLLQMSVFSAEGRQLAGRGPLRVVTLGAQKDSPVQLLVTNDGVAPARISLSLRADPPAPPPPEPESPPAVPPGDRRLPSAPPAADPGVPAPAQDQQGEAPSPSPAGETAAPPPGPAGEVR